MNLEDLHDERDVLLLSLEDLEREHDAGDLSEYDYFLLRNRYTARAAEVLRAIERSAQVDDGSRAERAEQSRSANGNGLSADGDGASEDHAGLSENGAGLSKHGAGPAVKRGLLARWSRTRWLIGGAGALVIALVLCVVLVVRSTSTRLPGETVSGSVSLGSQQQLQRALAQAQALEAEGDASQALELYHQVLVQEPTQDVALSETGWLEYQAGAKAKDATLLAEGQEEEQKAERADPKAFAPHLYLGSMFLVEGEATEAVAEYRSFLADGPPSPVVSSAAPFLDRAFESAGLAPPSLP